MHTIFSTSPCMLASSSVPDLLLKLEFWCWRLSVPWGCSAAALAFCQRDRLHVVCQPFRCCLAGGKEAIDSHEEGGAGALASKAGISRACHICGLQQPPPWVHQRRTVFSDSTLSPWNTLTQIHSLQRLLCIIWNIFMLHMGSKKAAGLFCSLALPQCAGNSWLTCIQVAE